MKELKDLTLRQFDEYRELLKDETLDIYTLFKLFDCNVEDMTIEEYNNAERKIQESILPTLGVKEIYTINGRRFKACLNLSKIKAGQFIDFQNYSSNFKLNEILSVFLIPQKKVLLGYRNNEYNKGYDIFEVQEFLYNNFTIGDANELANFFLKSSSDLLRVMKAYLEKKTLMQKKKNLELKQKALNHMSGYKHQKM